MPIQTIRDVVTSLIETRINPPPSYLPGTYPESATETEYTTAFTTSFDTAEESMYYTANMSGGGDAAEVDIISEAPLSESQTVDLPDGERERVVIEWSLW